MGWFELDLWQEIWQTLSKNKLRAFLTACGVFWGIFMLVLLLGMGRGLEHGVVRNFSGLAAHTVFVWSQRTFLPFQGLKPGRVLRFTNGDVDAVAQLDGVEHVAPRLQFGGWGDGQNVRRAAKTGNFFVLGDTPEFLFIEALSIVAGRFLNQQDLLDERKVAVIGENVQKTLFGNEEPLGQYLEFKGVYYLVVGIVKTDRGGEQGDRLASMVHVPLSTFQRAYNQRDRVGWLSLTVAPTASAAAIEKQVKQLLLRRHRAHPDDPQAIGSANVAEEFAKIQGLFRGIRGFVLFVGTLTLFAGALGVSNILLITVKERTKEIGIRKALGATPFEILRLIVLEALTLTSLAGYVGVVSGVGMLELLGRALSQMKSAPVSEPAVELQMVLLATVVLLVCGMLAGIVPARHAARIHPVEALRAE